MTGYEIAKRCVDLLGYHDAIGDSDLEATARKSSIEYINQTLLDICTISGKEYQPIESLDGNISDLSVFETSALVYGVCMWIAFGVGDGEKQTMFSHLYNAKRTALSHTDRIHDITPNPEG